MGATCRRSTPPARARWGALTLGLFACGLPATGIVPEGTSPGSMDAGRDEDANAGRKVDANAGGHDATTPRDARTDTSLSRSDTSKPREAAVDSFRAPEVGPMCTEACPIGAGCNAGAACVTLQCTSGTCAACAPSCSPGASCTAGSDCSSGVCSDGNCVVAASCAAILSASPSAPSAPYPIQPAGVGTPFAVFCDMTDAQGGWTLVAKMGTAGAAVMGGTPQVPGTFDYSSMYWTMGNTLNPDSTDMTETEAMFASYGSVPFQSILAMMTSIPAPPFPATPNQLVIPVSDASSLLHLVSTTAVNTLGDNLSRQDWVTLVSGASPQQHCNEHGINWGPSGDGCSTAGARIRIGLVANDGTDCCTPDSYVGFGGEYDGTFCDQASFSAGSMGGSNACTGGANVQDFGYLFVR